MQQQAIQEKWLQHFYQPKKISKEFLFDTKYILYIQFEETAKVMRLLY